MHARATHQAAGQRSNSASHRRGLRRPACSGCPKLAARSQHVRSANPAPATPARQVRPAHADSAAQPDDMAQTCGSPSAADAAVCVNALCWHDTEGALSACTATDHRRCSRFLLTAPFDSACTCINAALARQFNSASRANTSGRDVSRSPTCAPEAESSHSFRGSCFGAR